MLALRDAFRAAKPHRVGRTVFCLSQLWSRGGLQPEDKEELRNSKAPHYPARTVRFSQSTHARPLASLITVKLVGLWLDLLRSSPLKCSQHRKQLSPSWPPSGIACSCRLPLAYQHLTSPGFLFHCFKRLLCQGGSPIQYLASELEPAGDLEP